MYDIQPLRPALFAFISTDIDVVGLLVMVTHKYDDCCRCKKVSAQGDLP